MATVQQPVLVPLAPSSVIQGDPAARRFGLFFFAALVLLIIAAAIGIGVGNIAHYRYFPPNNRTLNGILIPDNQTVIPFPSNRTISGRRVVRRYVRERLESNRQFWLSMNKPLS